MVESLKLQHWQDTNLCHLIRLVLTLLFDPTTRETSQTETTP